MKFSSLFFNSVSVRVLLMLLSVYLAVSATCFLYWQDEFSRMSDENRTLLAGQKELSQKNYQTSSYVSQQSTRIATYKQVSDQILNMASNSSSVEVTQYINSMAKAAQIQKADIRWLEETNFPLYIEKTFELKVAGDFLSLERFFRTIAEQKRLLSFSYSQWIKSNRAENIVVIAKGHSYQWIAERL